jgi:raffinose/stachyose/melibiose transport system permease protein
LSLSSFERGGAVTSHRQRWAGLPRPAFRSHLLVFVLPAVLVYSVFLALPLLDSLLSSLYAGAAGGETTFVGLDNFVSLFTSDLYAPAFWRALGQTLVFLGVFLFIQNPIAILLATLLTSRGLRGASVYRNLLFIPTTLSIVIAGWIWSLMLNPVWGISDDILGALGLSGLTPDEGWQGSSWALIVVALVGVWQFIGLPMIFYVAALLQIDEELLDAARVDGAGAVRTFIHIKLPLIAPMIGVVSTLMFISNFVAFDHVYTMQGPLASPNFGTDIMGTFFHRTAFGTSAILANPSMGATIATVMFLLLLTVVAFVLLYVQPRLRRD